MIRLAIFASGTGTNALNFVHYFHNHPQISISKIYCNNPKAGIIASSKTVNTACCLFSKDQWINGWVTQQLLDEKTDYIILAGFLWLVPLPILQAFPNRIINIHPSLLPKYGGKGMYGAKVHEQVISDKQSKSGITIHLVNEHYDEGKILFQAEVELNDVDDAQSLAIKIHELEQSHYPKTVENFILNA